MMRKLFALLVLVVFLWPAAAYAAVALCAISGQVFNPDGTTLNNGTVQFNSQVTQVVGSTTIPPSIISTTTDANGNMAPMSVAQGLFGTFQFCQGHSQTNVGGAGGGCAAAINGLIPINTTGNIQAVIAGTLLPSIANATVNNITITNNANVGGLLETTTLKVDSNATVGGTLNVTGALTTTGALAGPSIALSTNGCTPAPIALAQSNIYSIPPDQDLLLIAGAHCANGTPNTFVADSNSAVFFGNYTRTATTGDHNAGWQWLGNTGLTAGSAFTPTVLMSLGDNAADASGIVASGFLNTNTLALQNNTTTAIQMAGAGMVSLGQPYWDVTAGAHYNGSQWIADATSNSGIGLAGNGGAPTIAFYMTQGATVGSVYTSTLAAEGSLNGWQFAGTNPVAIFQSNTNSNADIIQLLPQNSTQGIGIAWSGIHSIGTTANVSMAIDAKGGGSLLLNTINVGGQIFTSAPVLIQDNYHLGFANNGTAPPTLGTCSAGSFYGTSTDNVGQVNFSAAGATSCQINFGRAFANTPLCVCSVFTTWPGSVTSCAMGGSASSQTAYFGAAQSAGFFDYHCLGTQ